MLDPDDVVVDVATSHDAPIISNLLQLYAHDLSEAFGLELGADGRFSYQKLPLYWSEPESHFAFVIRCGNQIVGFALITRGSPASEDPDDFDVAEFFVVRRHRRSGVGRRAAFLLWNRFPVRWIVRVSERNPGGYRFWARVIADYAGANVVETTRPGTPHAWSVFSFNSVNRTAAV
jgi:predicted acetyltransferase